MNKMKLEARMVYVDGEIITEVETSKKFEKLGIENSEEEWVTYAHYKEDKSNRFAQIAFKICKYNEKSIPDDIEMYIQDKCQEKNKEPLIYDEKTGFWYEKRSNNNKVLSVIKAGTFNVVAKSKKNDKFKYKSQDINILPSAISYDNYERMLDELKSIRTSLIQDNQSTISAKTKDNVEEILYILEKLNIYLKRINIDTKVSLEMKHKKQKYTSIKKFSSKTLKEKVINPYANKFNAPVYEETYNIIENKMIKYALYKLELALKNERNLVKMNQRYIENELTSVNKGKDEIKEKNNKSTEVKLIAEGLDSKKSLLSYRKQEIQQKLQKIESCEVQLKELQNIKFVKNTRLQKVKLKHTQIFANDKNYIAVWKLLKKIDYKNPFDEKIIKLNYTMIRDTWNIYEYWCLFKMIYLLKNNQKWRLKNYKNVKEALDMYLNFKSEKLENFSVDMEHDYIENDEKKILNLKIVFNEETATNLETNTDTKKGMFKKPDYKFIFTKDDKKYYVYLDAKYRNYKMQEKEIWDEDEEITKIEDMWEKDIVDVAIGKYIKEFEGTDHEATASFIIHCDASNKKYIDYGGLENKNISSKLSDKKYEIPKHRYGAILLLPDHDASFLLLMRMIEEYHLKIYNVCWKCGEVDKINKEELTTGGGYEKFYYVCENCNEFWVKTHCGKKEINHTLVKHMENYHTEKDGNPWYVFCPDCNENN